jgi:hypothetical protein
MAALATADKPNGSESAQSPDVSKGRDNDQEHHHEDCNKHLQRHHNFTSLYRLAIVSYYDSTAADKSQFGPRYVQQR